MPTYSREDFERIAAAIGESVANVERHEKHFEAAATWYWLSHNPSKEKQPNLSPKSKQPGRKPKGKHVTPFVMHKRLTQIANAARKLLRHLEVSGPAQAPDGPGIHVHTIRKAFRRSVARAGMDPDQITPHVLRHTVVTHLVQAGVDLPTVQRISGHKTLTMVARYAHQSGAHIQTAMSTLETRMANTSRK